jgi:hypothetical protein
MASILTVKVDATDVRELVDQKIAELKEIGRAREHLQILCEMIRTNQTKGMIDYIHQLECQRVVDPTKYQQR